MNTSNDSPTRAAGKSVLMLCTVGGIGGATRVAGTLTAKMREAGVRTRLVFPDPPAADTLAALEWLSREGVEAESSADLPAWYAPHGPAAMWRLRSLVRSSGAAATHLHYGSNQIAFRDVIAVRAARRGRCVVMVHHAAPIRGWRTKILTSIGGNLAHRVVVSTPVLADLLAGIGVRRSRISVIPLGVSPPLHTPGQGEARSRLGIPAVAYVVATVARLDPGKNVPHLVRSMASLVDAGVDAHLLVAGVGDDFETVAALSDRLLGARGHVLGRVEEIDDVYAAADVFALPSREEGFGLVFLEAAGHGIPSVAYAVGGVPWAIDDGVTGILVHLNDEGGLTSALSRLHQDSPLRESMGKAARARVSTEFSDRLMAERHLRALGVHQQSQT